MRVSLLILVLLFSGFFLAQAQDVDFEEELAKAESVKEKARKSIEFFRNSGYAKLDYLIEASKHISKASCECPKEVASYYLHNSIYYSRRGKLDSAFFFLGEGEKKIQKAAPEDTVQLRIMHLNIKANIYQTKGEINKAIEIHNELRILAKKHNRLEVLAISNLNIAVCISQIGGDPKDNRYKKEVLSILRKLPVDNYTKSIRLSALLLLSNSSISAYGNSIKHTSDFAEIEYGKRSLDSAKNYLDTAKMIINTTPSSLQNRINFLEWHGKYLYHTEKYDDAIKSLDSAIGLRERKRIYEFLPGASHLFISRAYFKINQADSAKHYIELARQLVDPSHKSGVFHFHARLARVYRDAKMFDSAAYYFERSLGYHKNLYNENTEKEIAKIKEGYEEDSAQIKLGFAEEEKERNQLIAVLLGVTLLLALITFWLLRNRQLNKQRLLQAQAEIAESAKNAVEAELQDKNSALSKKQEELRATEAKLNNTLEELHAVDEKVAAKLLEQYPPEIIEEIELVELDSAEDKIYAEKLAAVTLGSNVEKSFLLIRKAVKYIEHCKNKFAENLKEVFKGQEDAAEQLRAGNLDDTKAQSLLRGLKKHCDFAPHLAESLRRQLGDVRFAQALYVYAHYTGQKENTKEMAAFWGYTQKNADTEEAEGGYKSFNTLCASLSKKLGKATKSEDETWYATLQSAVQELINAPRLVHALPTLREAEASENALAWIIAQKESLQRSPSTFYDGFKAAFAADFAALLEALENSTLNEKHKARAIGYLFNPKELTAKEFGEFVGRSAASVNADWAVFCEKLGLQTQKGESKKDTFFRHAKENWNV